MRNNTKGSYTLEAVIFLPLVLLTVLSLGYFMRVEGTWESCIHGAVDESALIASRSYGGSSAAMVGAKVRSRVAQDNPQLTQVSVKNLRVMYSDFDTDGLTSYRLHATMDLALPLGFQREFQFESKIKYRGFIGRKSDKQGMGSEGLERELPQDPVWIFPQSGEKYHGESCTYVKASVKPVVLTASVEKEYETCGLCNSGAMSAGSIAFCFAGEDTAYHRGTCSAIVRKTLVIDRTEAVKKGYGACSKCGGG